MQFAVDSQGKVIYSDNGGERWRSTSATGLSRGGNIGSIAVLSAKEVWIAGERNGSTIAEGALSHTTDGGSTWSVTTLSSFPNALGSENQMTAIYNARGTLWTSTISGRFYKSTDDGATWHGPVLTTGLGDPNNVYAIVGTSIMHTPDGGKTWSQEAPDLITGNLSSIWGSSANDIYVVGAAISRRCWPPWIFKQSSEAFAGAIKRRLSRGCLRTSSRADRVEELANRACRGWRGRVRERRSSSALVPFAARGRSVATGLVITRDAADILAAPIAKLRPRTNVEARRHRLTTSPVAITVWVRKSRDTGADATQLSRSRRCTRRSLGRRWCRPGSRCRSRTVSGLASTAACTARRRTCSRSRTSASRSTARRRCPCSLRLPGRRCRRRRSRRIGRSSCPRSSARSTRPDSRCFR
jgi:hypothetical protein